MKRDAEAFVRQCLHCLPTKHVPRPLGSNPSADCPNAVIEFDYLYIGPSLSGDEYVLVTRDKMISGYADLFATTTPTSRHAADSLFDWFTRLGVVHLWSSDRGSYFLNQVMDELRLLIVHGPTLVLRPLTVTFSLSFARGVQNSGSISRNGPPSSGSYATP